MSKRNRPAPLHAFDVADIIVPGYSPTMYAIVSALTGVLVTAPSYDGSVTRAQPVYGAFSITSDGYVIAQPGRRESGDFLGAASDFERNIRQYFMECRLTADQRRALAKAYARTVVDWRSYGKPQPAIVDRIFDVNAH